MDCLHEEWHVPLACYRKVKTQSKSRAKHLLCVIGTQLNRFIQIQYYVYLIINKINIYNSISILPILFNVSHRHKTFVVKRKINACVVVIFFFFTMDISNIRTCLTYFHYLNKIRGQIEGTYTHGLGSIPPLSICEIDKLFQGWGNFYLSTPYLILPILDKRQVTSAFLIVITNLTSHQTMRCTGLSTNSK